MDNPIRSFNDLDVYNSSYQAAISVIKNIIPSLPKEEKRDLADQLRRSCKAIPRLIAEGFAKKHQVRGFIKYLDDALAESNETIVSLSQVKDIYQEYVDTDLCQSLIKAYDICSRQLYNLARSWEKFDKKRK